MKPDGWPYVRRVLAVVLLLGCSGCVSVIDRTTELAVPVGAALDPTSRLYQMDTLVVMGYLRCFDGLTRLYATYDEAERSAVLNSITLVHEGEESVCPSAGEIELAHCSYRGRLLLRDQYTAPWFIVDEFLQCTDFGA